jgi:hypothetical protein
MGYRPVAERPPDDWLSSLPQDGMLGDARRLHVAGRRERQPSSSLGCCDLVARGERGATCDPCCDFCSWCC